MLTSRQAPPRAALAPVLLAALLALPFAATAQDAGDAGEHRKEEKRLREEEKKAAEQERKAAKKSKKEQTDEDKARQRFETSGKTAVEWYAEARRSYDAGKWLKARQILLPLEDSPRAIDIQEKVKLLIADTYYYQGGTLNLAEALARYRTFLTFHPGSPNAEYVQFQIANSYFKQLGPTDRDQSYTDNAIAEYQRLLDQHPESEHAEQARKNMMEARARRAQHEYEVASFYYAWKNYDAAADRFGQVLHERPELPQREAALYHAAESHYRAGNPSEGDAYAARLAADYPGSRWLSRLSKGSALRQHSAQAEKVARKRDHETERTHRRMLAREQARTRQIRKDSGLTRKIPTVLDDEGRPEPVAWTPPAGASAGPGEAARDAKEAKRSERAEREEEERVRVEAERAERREAAAKTERPKSAKEQAKEAKRAEKKAREDEKRAEKDRKRSEKLEAEEQAEKARKEKRKKGAQ